MRSSHKNPVRRRRGHDATGRSKGGVRYVKLNHWMLNTVAWRSLRPASRVLYIELAKLYNGSNNGDLWLSVRDAGKLIRVNKDTAASCFRELEDKGFIKRNRCGSFIWKLKQATTWILTEFDFQEDSATKDFTRWRPEKEKHGPKSGQNCPKKGTNLFTATQLLSQFVLRLGLRARSCTVPRSQIKGHI